MLFWLVGFWFVTRLILAFYYRLILALYYNPGISRIFLSQLPRINGYQRYFMVNHASDIMAFNGISRLYYPRYLTAKHGFIAMGYPGLSWLVQDPAFNGYSRV